ncbi:hypothetical protein ABT095_26135 [Kitasatospora sp. NPDC002227]|uniref:hypothetical protein n=1 Tax=Kitasatospora sp. NPDC002227 TaxID=3154773 RepID=UPI00333498B0
MTIKTLLAGPPTGVAAVAGEFETHLTLAAAEAGPALEGWAAGRGLKYTHIVLARGRTPSQPMLSWRAEGTYREQLDRAGAVAVALRGDGFGPVRVKVEAAPWARGVPQADAEAARLGPEAYFEHHVKVLLDPADRPRLVRAVAGHGAHVSWNARRADPSGLRQQFVTQRCHGVGLATAGRRLARLTAALTAAGYPPAAVEREFVVHDSNLAVDDGWLDER